MTCVLAGQVHDEYAWDNLRQVREGQKVRIVRMDLKSHEGAFRGYTGDGIRIDTGQGDITVLRADVFRVTALYNTRRAKRVLLACAIGAGAGLAVGAIADARRMSELGEEHFGAVLGLMIGAGAGAAAGLAVPEHPTLYRAATRPQK